MNRRKKGFSYRGVFEDLSVLLFNNFGKPIEGISRVFAGGGIFDTGQSFGKSIDNNSGVFAGGGISNGSLNSNSSNKSKQVLDFSYSSNKPGFIGLITNRGKDDNRLKGGFKKI